MSELSNMSENKPKRPDTHSQPPSLHRTAEAKIMTNLDFITYFYQILKWNNFFCTFIKTFPLQSAITATLSRLRGKVPNMPPFRLVALMVWALEALIRFEDWSLCLQNTSAWAHTHQKIPQVVSWERRTLLVENSQAVPGSEFLTLSIKQTVCKEDSSKRKERKCLLFWVKWLFSFQFVSFIFNNQSVNWYQCIFTDPHSSLHDGLYV